MLSLNRFVISGVAALGLSLAVGTATAADRFAIGQDTFKLQGGYFLTDIGSDVTVGIAGEGDDDNDNEQIGLEDGLGLGKSDSSIRADAYFRLGKRHRIFAGYYSLGRKGSRVLDEQVEWEDAVYDVGVNVDSFFDWQVIPVSYGYSFWQTEDLEIAITAGVHFIDLEMGITGTATVEGEGIVQVNTESSQASGPFPLVGLRADYQIAPSWQIGFSGQWLRLKISEFDGRLLDLVAYIEYYFTKNIGVGVAVNHFNMRVKVANDDWDGRVKNRYTGFLGYLAVKF